jgi:phosphoribosylglycinamide formyltransferase-1
MSGKLKVGVLISGRGSNLQALIDASRSADYPAEIVLVVSNVADAFGLSRAKAASIPTSVIDHKKYKTRESFDEAVDGRLREAGVGLICLAGFMRIFSDAFVRKWEGRLINIHPSLLPDFKGTHVHERVIAAGVKLSGCTVHYVTPELDSGPIIAQSKVPVLPGDTPDALAERVLEAEHKLYPEALKRVAVDEQLRFAIANRRLIGLKYSGSVRVVEPHDYGVQKGVPRLLGYQQSPVRSGWRLFDLAKVEACSILAETFAGSRGDAHQRHHNWDTIYARVA